MKRVITIYVIIAAIAGASLGNIGTGSAFNTGDPWYNWIFFSLNNDISSTSVVSSLAIYGSTATDGPVKWRGYRIYFPNPLQIENFESSDSWYTITISSGFSFPGIDPGDGIWFELLIGQDMALSELIGVEVHFNFEDGSTWYGVFVDDPDAGYESIVLTELSVEEKVDYILDKVDESVADGSLTGIGKKDKKAEKELEEIVEQLMKVSELITEGKTKKALKELADIYACIDGEAKPKDTVEGEAAEQIAIQILALISMLES